MCLHCMGQDPPLESEHMSTMAKMIGCFLRVLNSLFQFLKCKQDLTFESGKIGRVSLAFYSFDLQL